MSDRYTFTSPGYDIVLEADRLRRDRHELLGELSVKCGLPGAQTVNGYLLTGDFNFSSVKARQERAKLLAQRAKTNGQIDFFGLLEDFVQRVFEAERTGAPAVDLRTLPRQQRDDEIKIDDLVFPRRHPSVLFGDGGAAKSYTALWGAGGLAQRGLSIALFDWELCGEDHRDRLERLFGSEMPVIHYVRCERPLSAESDRLQRIVRDLKVDYAIFDSVAFACDGPPEAAEVAGRYFRAVRQIGCGSLHVAHVSKSSENSDQKPFGSTFWHNGARSTWFVQGVDAEQTTLRLGFFNRKSNLGPLHPPASYLVSFGERTVFEPAKLTDSEELSGKLTIRQRMTELLKRGSMTVHEIAEQLDERIESVSKSVKRNTKHFIVLEGGRVGLRA